MEASRGGAVVATRIVHGDESRRRRGRDADSPWRRVAAAPRPRTWIVRGDGSERPRPSQVEQHLDEIKPEGAENEAVEQVAFADRIILNKIDLVEEADLARVEKRLRAINAFAPVSRKPLQFHFNMTLYESM